MAYTHPGANPDQRIAKIASAVKKLARILGIPIFLVSQLPRKPKMKHSGNSILSDLYDSVVIESYADVLLFLHNREYHMNDRQRGKAEIIVAKHRNRHIKEHVYLTFYGRQHRFANLLESNNCDVEDECIPW